MYKLQEINVNRHKLSTIGYKKTTPTIIVNEIEKKRKRNNALY